MVSKRRISYQWRMFIPLVSGMWIVFICMGLWVFHTNQKYKKDRINEQLDLVNSRIMAFYNSGAPESEIRPYLKFVYDYYRDIPAFDLIRISVYKNGMLNQSWGEPIQLSPEELSETHGLTQTPGVRLVSELRDRNNHDQYFYYQVKRSDDGQVVVCAVLPFDTDINEAIAPNMTIFTGLFIVALVITSIAFFSSRHFARNIRLLRSVAQKAAADDNFIPDVDFPHDELGDINRQIVQMYNERTQAMQRQKREHTIAMHAIEEKARAKRQMSNNINHELRTPVGIIKGYLDTIIENPDMDDDIRYHFIIKARDHANRLAGLIADVSAITRLDEGGEVLSTEELDFHDIAFTVGSEIEESGLFDKMTFSFDVPLDCKIQGNYNLLNGMLMNLARNAAAYSKGDTCELICTGEDNKFYEFVFRDNGVGVGEEHIPHLFERFYRVDSGRARKTGGTGLGLPIVQSTILAHGGKITVGNRPSGGLYFRFTLPKSAGLKKHTHLN